MSETPKHTVKVFDSAGDVAAAASDALLELGEARRLRGENGYVALSGGSTPRAMYDLLRERGSAVAAALRCVHFFFGDERRVPNDHEDSNVRLAMEGFLAPLGLPVSHIHAPDGGAACLDREAARLTRVLDATLPREGGMPRFDLVFLGMGGDGHTASLFPGTGAVHARLPGYAANEIPQLETWRLTLTYPILNAARRVMILCTGAGKAEKLEEILENRGDGAAYPIQRINAGEVVWMLDRDAAARLPSGTVESGA